LKLKQIIIETKRAVFSSNIANHSSHILGEGMDFSGLREYDGYDDIKKIDHLTTAKRQKPYVRLYKEEKELNIVTISLLGGSTYFGSQTLKKDFIAKIVALIGFSALKQSDKFSSFIFTDKVENFIIASKKPSLISKSVENILDFNPLLKKVELKKLENSILKYIKKKSLIFLIGDFFQITSFRKLNIIHEIIPIIIRESIEEKLPKFGQISLIDPQTNLQIELNLDKKTVIAYKDLIDKNDKLLYKSLKKDRIKFTKIYTNENPIKKLNKLFIKRYI